MPPSTCRYCGSKDLFTDYAAGNVVCQNCFKIVEEGLLVSEVGFSEGAGGRVHVQGTFVSNFSTGIPGFRGRAKEETAAAVKKQGNDRIKMIIEDMRIKGTVYKGSCRWFSLAVDQRFTRGRRTEYILAACIYLACRVAQEPAMLIDFSERLAVNVYELGATYLRLRSYLALAEELKLPEIDPAIYNLHFANQLDLPDVHTAGVVAADASRLVKRFQADWMTQGRRPAGVCGASLVIAARMSGYLRTPEEVAQLVKVAPETIRKRLREFAMTSAATKTVKEWRETANTELEKIGDEEPPAVRERREREARARKRREEMERLRRRQNGVDVADDVAEDGAEAAAGEDSEESRASKRRKGKHRADSSEEDDNATRAQEAIQAAADEYGEDGGSESGDRALELMDQAEYAGEVAAARDNPEEDQAEKAAEKRAFLKQSRAMLPDPEDVTDEPELDDLVETFDQDGADKEEGAEVGESQAEEQKMAAVGQDFDQWDDPEATITYLGERLFSEEQRLLQLNEPQLRSRVKNWIANREPKEVLQELECIEHARMRREEGAKEKPEAEFPDIDDEELEGYYVLEEDEMKLRARLWLNHNAKWLEEDKERQAKKAAYAKAHGLDPNKPKKRKKRTPRHGPFPTAREAIDNFASTKKFSSRLNYSVLQNMGLAKTEVASLQSFDDEKDDEKEDDDGELEDDKDDGLYDDD